MSLDKIYDELCDHDKEALKKKVEATSYYQLYVLGELFSDAVKPFRKALSDIMSSLSRGFRKGKHDN